MLQRFAMNRLSGCYSKRAQSVTDIMRTSRICSDAVPFGAHLFEARVQEEEPAMSQAKSTSKGNRRRKAVSVLGIAGMSLATVDGAAASVNGSATDIASQNASRQAVNFGEEEISDVSLSTFYVFDKENQRASQSG